MFLLNSRSSLVTATPANPRRRIRVPPGHPFSRSYGVNLPSSLTRVISPALVSSTHLPVSVCGTVQDSLPRGFSRRTLAPLGFVSPRCLVSRQTCMPDGFAYPAVPRKNTVYQPRAWNADPCPPFGDNASPRLWNINQMSIAYAKRLGLGPAKLKRTNLP